MPSLAPTKYYLRAEEGLALRALEARVGQKTLILEGPPGTGKTAFSQFLAERWGAQYLYLLSHNWLSDEELFVGVHVGRVAAGVEHPEEAYQLGILARAAVASQAGPVVICLDEIDKAPQRAEALLLDFLQHGRVFGPTGEVWQAKCSNLTVVLTTNGVRPLMEATLRRGLRVKMTFLPPATEADIVRQATGAPMGAIRCAVRMAGVIRKGGATAPSLQEIRNLMGDLAIAHDAADVRRLIEGWLCKEPEDWQALTAAMGDTPEAILWGEYRRASK